MKKAMFKIFCLSLSLALVFSFLPAQAHPAVAVSPDIVISQVYGGGGNAGAPYTHDFVELFNRGTTAVSLAGWSIQYASATGTGNFGASNTQLTELPAVSLLPGQYYLVQEAGGTNGVALPTPNLVDSSPIAMSATGGKVALVNQATTLGCNGGSTPCSAAQLAKIIDLVGYGTANFYEGSAAAPTLSNSTAALRNGNGATDTDNNSADFTAGAPNPRYSPPPEVAPRVTTTSPANNAVDVALGADLLITFSEAVNVTGDWFSITCSLSGSHTAVVSGGPTAFTLNPDADFVKNDNCTVNILAADVTDQDSNDPPDNMDANYSFSFLPLADACLLPFIPISDVQGNGAASPLVDQTVDVQGIVVGDFQNNASPDYGNLNGFHLQSAAADEDADPATSEGVFIYYPGGTLDVAVGDGVRVHGSISEYYGLTEITAAQVWACSTGNTVTPTPLSLPVSSADAFEAYEGMLVTFPQSLIISEYYNFDQFGEIVLTSTRHMTPTAIFEPGSAESYQAAQDFLLDKITLDDGRSSSNPDPAIHPNGSVFNLDNLFRGGDTLTNVTGVMDYSYDLYRIQPTMGAEYTATNPRPTTVPDVGGTIKVVSMNTLNYFTTLDNGVDDICGPNADQECRGADTAEELVRQQAKLVAAITAMDADVIGLLEIENNVTDAPIATLVDALNTAAGAGTFAYIATGAIGTDAIRPALIYKPASVTPYGTFAILDSSVDARFLDDYNRPALAQSFVDTNGGIFTVAVNHFKSKGSDCNAVGDPDLGDGAGNCNLTRKAAAQALVDWLDSDPTGSGDLDVLIIGDLNSYDKEDPIDAILAGPDDKPGTFDDYVDMTFMFEGENAYSYVFDGQIGYLDYAMTSTLADQVTGTATWHVNADEPDLIDYDMSYKKSAQDALYAPDFYRYSDHDPVIIGLNLIPAYDFNGFYDPVLNAPGVTVIKAGSTVPVKFSLGGNWGLDIFEYGYPVLMKCTDCTFTDFEPDKLVYMDRSKLLYSASADQYIFTWKTNKKWAGTCWILNILLNDGSIHQAYFKIK